MVLNHSQEGCLLIWHRSGCMSSLALRQLAATPDEAVIIEVISSFSASPQKVSA